MKNKVLPIYFATFAITVLLGGFIGYLKAGSLISLIMSAIFSSILLTGAALLYKQHYLGYYVSFGATILLIIVFLVRYINTNAPFPGIMAIYCSLVFITAYYLLKKQPVNFK